MSDSYYPILMKLDDRLCLVVGGGQVAGRKASSLIQAGASVRIVAPKISEEIKAVVDSDKAEWLQEEFKPEHLDGIFLAIASTDNERVNKTIYDQAVKRAIPVNIVDKPELCTFIVPSVTRRGDLIIAISTSGKSPAVAKMIRKKLEKEFGEEWVVFLEIMGEARHKAMRSVRDQKQREKIFNRLAGSDMLDRIKRGDIKGARNLVVEIMGQ